TPLNLEEGYELSIKSIDIDGNKVSLELSKDGSVVDSKVIFPSKDNPTMADKTYYYKKDVGDSKDLVTIAAHFKNAFRGADQNLATIDGIWQISDVPMEVKVDTEYDKMRIASVTADTITMDNKDNTVTLSKNKDIDLMGDVKILTSDQDVIDDANPQRYYLYKEATIEGAANSAVEAAFLPEAAPAIEAARENMTVAFDFEEAATENVAEAKAAEKTATETGVQTAEPSIQDIDDAEVIRQNLPDGTIIEIIPRQMKVGEQRQIVAAISRTPKLNMTDTVKTAIVEIEKIKPEEYHQSALPVYKEMKIDLVVMPEDFKIAKQHASDKQHVPLGDFAVWRWLVTPTKDGPHRVDFVVSVLDPPVEKVVHVKTYDVEVDYFFISKEWLEKNYQWLFGSLFGSGLILWFLKRREGGK
ncbi:MAG: hypothetical protein M0Q43_13700, partial [Methanothrix sp.]|nr:hypothetical protein [Methanothrix sp.]